MFVFYFLLILSNLDYIYFLNTLISLITQWNYTIKMKFENMMFDDDTKWLWKFLSDVNQLWKSLQKDNKTQQKIQKNYLMLVCSVIKRVFRLQLW